MPCEPALLLIAVCMLLLLKKKRKLLKKEVGSADVSLMVRLPGSRSPHYLSQHQGSGLSGAGLRGGEAASHFPLRSEVSRSGRGHGAPGNGASGAVPEEEPRKCLNWSPLLPAEEWLEVTGDSWVLHWPPCPPPSCVGVGVGTLCPIRCPEPLPLPVTASDGSFG